VLVVALATAVVDMPARWLRLEASLPVISLWPDIDAQYQAQLGVVPYDLLRTADSIVPRDAAVLLVTSGHDVTRSEYTTFHRALYFLTPRPVWWLSPAPSDGTWKSRWWLSAPLTAEAIKREAASRGVSYIVMHDVAEPLDLGTRVAEVRDGYIVSLARDNTSGALAPITQSAGPAWPLQVAAAIVTIVLIGSVILSIVRRLGYFPGRIEGLALALSLGAGVTSVVMLWLNALGLHLHWQIGVIACLAIAWVVWGLRTRLTQGRSPDTSNSREPPANAEQFGVKEPDWTKYIRGLIGLLLVVQIAFSSIRAIGRPLDVWDSWVNWGVKARTIFLDGYISPAVYADPSRIVTHLDYPLSTPLLQAWFFGWLGAPDDRFAGVPSVLFYLALLAICFTSLVSAGAGKTTALAATAAIVTIAHITGMVALVFAEMPLTLLCVIAGVYMLKWLRDCSRGALLVASIAGGLMPWTKKEGLILLLALGIAILVMNFNRRHAWSGVGGMALAAGLISGPWWLFVAYNGIASPDFLPVTAETLQANIGRAEAIARLVLNSLFGSSLGYTWPLIALAGVILCWPQRGRAGKRIEDFLPVAAVIFIIMMSCSYFFSAFVPYTDHILSSIDRLIAPVTPLIVIWLVLRTISPNHELESGTSKKH